MRAFFALPLDAALTTKVSNWRENSLPPLARPVPAENLHVTLAFLGDISPEQCQTLIHLCNDLQFEPFDLEFGRTGYWPRQEIFYLEPFAVPAELLTLHDDLNRLLRLLNLKADRRTYHPHLTLARRCETAPPAPLNPLEFTLPCNSFVLYESVRLRKGVRYEPVYESCF